VPQVDEVDDRLRGHPARDGARPCSVMQPHTHGLPLTNPWQNQAVDARGDVVDALAFNPMVLPEEGPVSIPQDLDG
jgi:hypothetical protein